MTNAAENIDTGSISAIDAAIAKAKARATQRTKTEGRPSTEEREASRAAAKAERERLRAEKTASARSAPVHMSKVEKAASRLPQLGAVAQGIFDEARNTLNPEQLTALALHVQHHNRVSATMKAVSTTPLKVGQVVTITGGDPKYIGQTGHLEKVQRIRCYVKVPGSGRLVYCFTSDVSPVDGGEEIAGTDSGSEVAAAEG